jgi:hypothetical protein
VPYKDPEKRRQFQKEYKRKWRAAQAKNHPFKGVKVYLCARFPSLNVGLASFDGGFLITGRRDVQLQVERHPEFGRFIIPLAVDLTPIHEDE